MSNQHNSDKIKRLKAFLLWYYFGMTYESIAKYVGYKSKKSVGNIINAIPTYVWRDVEYIEEVKKLI